MLEFVKAVWISEKIVSKKRVLISLKRIHKSSTALATDQFETAY